MKYYVGIDGGGTKTKVVIIDEHENLVFENTSGPSSIDTVDSNTTIASFNKALEPFILKHINVTFQAIFIGVGGIVSEKDSSKVELFSRHIHGVGEHTLIKARNDMENALYSGLLFDEGIALICGTGMVAFGKNKNGVTHKAGGWGYREGDLGSSYDLGMRSLRHVIKAFDGRDHMTNFSKAVAKAIGMNNTEDFFHIINDKYLDRTWIASLAPLVTTYYLEDDVNAKHIVDQATDELALAVYAVARALDISDSSLVIIGSLGHAKGYKELLHVKINNLLPKIHVIDPKVDPAYAAALMAKRL
jgi:N-acetylglucosamine kinase-like BadF-type ATPase